MIDGEFSDEMRLERYTIRLLACRRQCESIDATDYSIASRYCNLTTA